MCSPKKTQDDSLHWERARTSVRDGFAKCRSKAKGSVGVGGEGREKSLGLGLRYIVGKMCLRGGGVVDGRRRFFFKKRTNATALVKAEW